MAEKLQRALLPTRKRQLIAHRFRKRGKVNENMTYVHTVRVSGVPMVGLPTTVPGWLPVLLCVHLLVVQVPGMRSWLHPWWPAAVLPTSAGCFWN